MQRSDITLIVLLLWGTIVLAGDQNVQVDCSKVQCPTTTTDTTTSKTPGEIEDFTQCPSDSYRLPSILPLNFEDLEQIDDNFVGKCCPDVTPQHIPGHHHQEKCQCIPGLNCGDFGTNCPSGTHRIELLSPATGEPGFCCPKYKCVEVDNDSPEDDDDDQFQEFKMSDLTEKGNEHDENNRKKKCRYKDKEYFSGESWSQIEDCTTCFCSNGVASCHLEKCEDFNPECRLAHDDHHPETCCPVCIGCITTSGKIYNNSETWEEDRGCTNCECNAGKIICHAAMCHSTCLNPTHVPGECCPRCEESGIVECPYFECHQECPNGYNLDDKGCPICHCNKCPNLADCTKECHFGFRTNSRGCAICECKSEDEDYFLGHLAGGHCTTNSADGELRYDGEEWFDGCRHCICLHGLEMCSLITCSVPKCEHPVFYPGDCCPRCPNEPKTLKQHAPPANISSLCTQDKIEGDTWHMDCFTCTCHTGQVFCKAPACPPAPCPDSTITDCCLTCPSSAYTPISSQSQLFSNSTTTNTNVQSTKSSLKCLSDDSHTEYADGDMWKVGACSSCKCSGKGTIECFSAASKCPHVNCQQPVLAKNQCCPICLDKSVDINGALMTRTKGDFYDGDGSCKNSTSYNSDLRILDGEEWSIDDCTSCKCINSQIICTKMMCSPMVGCQDPVSLRGKCCPVCFTETKSRKRPILDDGGGDNKQVEGSSSKSRGIFENPYCAIIITFLSCIVLLCTLYGVRQCFYRRRVVLIKKAPFHSNSSSNNSTSSPPVTPDCCYKVLSEQKTPLCHNSSNNSTNSNGHNRSSSINTPLTSSDNRDREV